MDSKPKLIKITKAGWIYIVLTIFLGIAGANTGNNLIYLIDATLLAFMGISGFFGKRNISKIRVNVEFSDEKYALEEFPLKITIKNEKKFLPSFLININVEGKEVLIPYVKNNSDASVEFLYLFEKRGIGRIENIYICSVFPFNFFVRCFQINKEIKTVVFPKPDKCIFFEGKDKRRKKEKEQGKVRAYEGEISGLKEYVEGEPLKYISWKHYAKSGELYTKELYIQTEKPVFIDFEKIKGKDIEKSLSCVSYLINEFYKRKIPVGLKINGKTFKPSTSYIHKISMLKELALYV